MTARVTLKLAAMVCAAACLSQVRLFSQAAAPAAPAGAPDPWFARSPKPKDFETPKLPWNTFSIELPKNWQMTPTHGGILLAAAEKTRNEQPVAAIFLEQVRLRDTLVLNDAAATFEKSATQDADPAGQNFESEVKDVDGRRFILLKYTRPGFLGPDQIVQYSVPADLVLYRLICIAPEAQMAKYRPIFAHVAMSFRTTPPKS